MLFPLKDVLLVPSLEELKKKKNSLEDNFISSACRLTDVCDGD